MTKKLQEITSSAWALVLSRLSMMITGPILGIVAWIGVGFYNDTKENDRTLLVALSAVNATLSMLAERIEGGTRTQAAIDAALSWRIDQFGLSIADHETRIRGLEAWQRVVNNRDDPV